MKLKNNHITNYLKLLVYIGAICFVVFIAAPGIDNLPLSEQMVSYIDKHDIDATALFYTEVEEFSIAEFELVHSQKYFAEAKKYMKLERPELINPVKKK